MQEVSYKLNFEFAKQGVMKYISHLDLMRLFSRSFRRADFPVKITQGFNPHHKFSIQRALKLGLESDCEEATVTLTKNVAVEDFKMRLQAQLPEGIIVKHVKYEEQNE